MERLTELVNGELMWSCRGQHFNSYGEFQYAVLNKLSQYENTELTPQEIENLKQKQIPKKIIRWGYRNNAGVCPNCQENISRYPYCPLCGQKLDWSVIDEM